MSQYRACRNCGRYVAFPDLVHQAYCSEDCLRAFSTCTTCGRYFARGKGFDAERCSRECAVRYEITRKYGPQPVTVVTEV